jgi:hypothetical protein
MVVTGPYCLREGGAGPFSDVDPRPRRIRRPAGARPGDCGAIPVRFRDATHNVNANSQFESAGPIEVCIEVRAIGSGSVCVWRRVRSGFNDSNNAR